MVLRVQQMRSLGAGGMADIVEVSVAMPDSRPTKFSAVRSPASTRARGPEIVSTCTPAATRRAVATWASMPISGDSFRNVATASGSPAITPACRATRMAWAPGCLPGWWRSR